MKAIIFNSGIGKRMGEFTQKHPKAMVTLYNGETIFERQIRILGECGIDEFVITTGPFEEQFKEKAKNFPEYKFHFVHNPLYDKTNYIYSMFLASEHFDDDFLLLHGDLVFNKKLVEEVLADDRPSICLYNEEKSLPEKDFKGRIIDGKLREVSINIFDDDCFAFQPLYKLQKKDLLHWAKAVATFVQDGNTGVYAENALNTILEDMDIRAKSYKDNYIDEIDNFDDYDRVSNDIAEFDKKKPLIKERKN